ncbi:RNA polymerase-associated protein rtf1 [Malassezia brasiliensis]|uniref:RNA polymerase-associated protein rtf1 n=1 Tax=Malassezia brasiliensis TaxID=1821822 RepID=A0AAF0INW4_9BASI|nr:RNA polymerase-associated protein rtf1 [Malassezia brasiliensis]
MSEDGLDEELIALVGEGQSSPPAGPTRSQRRTALLGDSSDEEEDEEEVVAYPLEGIYKDEEDREHLLSMNELEREEVLAQRRDEISRRNQKAQLAAMVRSQQAAAGKTRKSKHSEAEKAKRRKRSRDMARRELEDLDDPFAESEEEDVFAESESDDERPARRPSTTKASKLSELRRKRQERQHGTARVDESDDEPAPQRRRVRDDSDSAYESESDYEDRRATRRPTTAAEVLIASEDEPPSLELLNSIRVGRDEIERLLFLPSGPEALRGCFIRCSWGMRPKPEGGQEHVYRVHQITQLQQREDKFYDVSADRSGRFLNTYITFRWNGKEHSVDLRPISTQPISESERQRWIATLKGNATKFPSATAIQEKQHSLDAVLNAPLTEEDIKKMIQRKRELRAAAEANGAASAYAAPNQPVESGVRYDEHAMAQINERNRRQDRERIQEAERRAARAKRAQARPAPAPAPAAPVSHVAVAEALAAAPSGTAVVPSIDIDLGDF